MLTNLKDTVETGDWRFSQLCVIW